MSISSFVTRRWININSFSSFKMHLSINISTFQFNGAQVHHHQARPRHRDFSHIPVIVPYCTLGTSTTATTHVIMVMIMGNSTGTTHLIQGTSGFKKPLNRDENPLATDRRPTTTLLLYSTWTSDTSTTFVFWWSSPGWSSSNQSTNKFHWAGRRTTRRSQWWWRLCVGGNYSLYITANCRLRLYLRSERRSLYWNYTTFEQIVKEIVILYPCPLPLNHFACRWDCISLTCIDFVICLQVLTALKRNV